MRRENSLPQRKAKSFIPAVSATVGTSGAMPERLADDTPSTFTRPIFSSGIAAGMPGKYISTWPPMRS